MTLFWSLLLFAFLLTLSVCYWKRATIASRWQRPSKEPVDAIADRLGGAVDRLERVHTDLERTVSVMQNGVPTSEHFFIAAPSQREP